MASQLPPQETLAAVRARRAHSVKWQRYPEDILPAWVADMDFPPPATALEAGIDLLMAGDTGYPSDDLNVGYRSAYQDWTQTNFGSVPHAIRTVADVVAALRILVQAVTDASAEVIVLTPSYPPFFGVVKSAERQLVTVPMEANDGRYTIDLNRLEQAASRSHAQALILCNPHNPTGRVFERDELLAVAAIAAQTGLIVISDEIHQDLRAPHTTHIPFSSLDHESAHRAIVLSSPSKSFNIAGLKVAHIELPVADDLRAKIEGSPLLGLTQATSIGLAVGARAYRTGQPWLSDVRSIIDANFALVEKALSDSEKVRFASREGTYLMWGEVTVPIEQSAYTLLLERGRVAVGPGEDYLPGSPTFFRLNLAAWPSTVETMVERIINALDTL